MYLIFDTETIGLPTDFNAHYSDVQNWETARCVQLAWQLHDKFGVLIDSGNDIINGAAGADIISGGAGDDDISGGQGDDSFTGGNGNDTFNVNDGTDAISDLSSGDILKITAGATANATGIAGFTATSATINNSTVAKGKLTANNSGVTIDLGLVASGNGFSVTGGTGADTLKGSSGNDIILGGNESDTLQGNSGDDSLTGGSGDDTMTGNNGADTFNVDSGTDTICLLYTSPSPRD